MTKENTGMLPPHIIPHLKKYGNVFVPYKTVEELGGEEAVLAELRNSGMECEMELHFNEYRTKGKKKIEVDAVIRLVRRIKKEYEF